jgi:hypothetical protein
LVFVANNELSLIQNRNHIRRLEGEYDADISLSLKSSIVPYRSITTKA